MDTKLTIHEQEVLDLLKPGKRSRYALIAMTKLDDRTIRQIIEKLRLKGYPICSSSKTGGYWMAKDTADWEIFIVREVMPRHISLSHLLAAAIETGDQMRRDGE